MHNQVPEICLSLSKAVHDQATQVNCCPSWVYDPDPRSQAQYPRLWQHFVGVLPTDRHALHTSLPCPHHQPVLVHSTAFGGHWPLWKVHTLPLLGHALHFLPIPRPAWHYFRALGIHHAFFIDSQGFLVDSVQYGLRLQSQMGRPSEGSPMTYREAEVMVRRHLHCRGVPCDAPHSPGGSLFPPPSRPA